MKKPDSIPLSVYEVPPQRGGSVLWKLATFVLLAVVIAQHFAYSSGRLWSGLKKQKVLQLVSIKQPLTPEQERTIREIAARGGTVHYDRYNGVIDVSFAIGAPCEGCGQTWAFAPTGSPAEFRDDHLVLLKDFTVDSLDFTDSGISADGALAIQRAHPKCQVKWSSAE